MRISLDAVRFKNILLFGNQMQEVSLLPGFNVIVGRFPGNTSSNRAGKTSFTDVISFALYGRVLKSLTQAQLINWRNKKNCRTEIDFTKGNDKYTIIRELKPNAIEVYRNGVLVPFVGARDIQRQIEEDILGISYNTFVNLTYTNINFSVPILKMKSTQKRMFMESLFNLEMFSKLNVKCMSKLNAIEKKIAALNNQIKVNQAVSNEHTRQISELQSGLDVNEDLIKRKARVENEISEPINIEGVNEKLVTARTLLNKFRGICSAISTKIEVYKIKEKNLRDIANKTGGIKSEHIITQKKIKEITKLLSEHDTVEQIDEKINAYVEKIKELQPFMDKEHNNAVSQSSLLAAKKEDLNTLRKESTCPLCRRGIDDYMVYTIIENEISELGNKYNSFMDSFRDVKQQIDDITTKKKALGEEKKVVVGYKEQLVSLNKQLDTLKSFMSQRDDKAADKVGRYYKVNMKLSSLLEEYKNKCDKCEQIIVKLDAMVEKYNKNKSLIEEQQKLRYQIEYNNEQKDNIRLKIDEIRSKDAELANNNKQLEEETLRLNRLSDYLSFIKDVCKDDNIKQHAISSVIPYLTKKTNEYLATIGYQFYVEFDRWVDCTIKGPGIYDGTYASLSGGESRSVDIALMLAFNDIARLSSPNYFDILILDELLDSSVDSSSISSVVSIIKNKQQQDNLKLFLVTHRQEINTVVDFDHIYQVERTQGYSKVSVL